jgi:RNA recognition motif-containing protein
MHNYQELSYLEQNLFQENIRRNKRAISLEENKDNEIDIERVEFDGRCTVMVRNIPIKYTQEMLIELFSKDEKIQKFDFFYLPIDPNVTHLSNLRITAMSAMPF